MPTEKKFDELEETVDEHDRVLVGVKGDIAVLQQEHFRKHQRLTELEHKLIGIGFSTVQLEKDQAEMAKLMEKELGDHENRVRLCEAEVIKGRVYSAIIAAIAAAALSYLVNVLGG